MNLRVLGYLSLSVVGAVAVTCKEDPTASNAGKPAGITFTPNPLFLNVGDSGTVTTQVVDQTATPLVGPITGVSTDANVALVTPAAVPPDPTGTTAVFKVKALAAGPAYVKASGQGLTDSARVNAMPVAFTGAISSTTPAGGDIITINATPVLKFTPATTVVFGGGPLGVITTFSTEALGVLVPFSDAGPLTISNINVTYVQGRTVTLETTATVPGDLRDTSYATAPTVPIPAVGDSAIVATDIKPGTGDSFQCVEFGPAGPPNFSKGPCVMYRFDVPGPDSLNLLFKTDWDDAATDVDVYVCVGTVPVDPANDCGESGFTGASGRKPEFLRMPLVGGVRTPTPFKYPPGSHWFVIELFDGTTPRNITVTIFRVP